MLDYRFYFYPISWIFFLVVGFYILNLNLIFGLIYFAFLIVSIKAGLNSYLKFLWWPYEKWIDTSVVNMERVKVPTTLEGKFLQGVVIRAKDSNPNEKHVGILFHHGFTGKKERNYLFTIPLALNGFTVLAMDARGHGESKDNAFKMLDIPSILSDVKKEIDYLENLPDVDKNKLIMMGHSMGCMATLTRGYEDKRIKKVIGLSGFYDLVDNFKNEHKILYRFMRWRGPKILKKSVEEWNQEVSSKFFFEKGHPIPDKERVYLVHCKEDRLVTFDNSAKIKEALNLPDENVLFLKEPKQKYFMSAHRLIGQSTIISDFLIKVARSLEND